MKKFDLVVVGGGFSGAAAAISAARNGLSVLILEKGNCFGGAASNCLVQPYMINRTKINGEFVELSSGIFKEINDRLGKYGKFKNNFFDEEYLKLVLNDMVLESGAEILFHAHVIKVNTEDGRVGSVEVATKRESLVIEADYFVDATGDANIAYMANYPFRLGRENDSLCQPMTLCFRLGNADVKDLKRNEINKLYQEKQKKGEIINPRENVLIFENLTDGVLHFNTTRIVRHDPTDIFDVTKAEIEARKQVFEIYDFLKANFDCFKNSEIISTASEIGVRESRMIDGEYILSGTDIKNCTQFEDSVALGNYDIDIHNPEGTGTSHYYFKPGEYYSIPYRCLIPKDAKNLLVCGRCVSADHEAQASLRIMPIVCCLGEAAGEAIAIAAQNKIGVKDIDVKLLRDNLNNRGALTQIV